MGEFIGAITAPDEEATLCPECGGAMHRNSHLCIYCNGAEVGERQAVEWLEENEPRKLEQHNWYRERMEQDGWTIRDVLQHTIAERKRRGDPARPRFWTGTSIGQPKSQ
jgi:hypothetical protein